MITNINRQWVPENETEILTVVFKPEATEKEMETIMDCLRQLMCKR